MLVGVLTAAVPGLEVLDVLVVVELLLIAAEDDVNC